MNLVERGTVFQPIGWWWRTAIVVSQESKKWEEIGEEGIGNETMRGG